MITYNKAGFAVLKPVRRKLKNKKLQMNGSKSLSKLIELEQEIEQSLKKFWSKVSKRRRKLLREKNYKEILREELQKKYFH